jgi:hypothetical protein
MNVKFKPRGAHMKLNPVLVLTALISLNAFASNDVQGPDVKALNPTDFSSVCLIQVFQPSTQQGYLCTGSVISSNAILTAGHCVLDDAAQAKTAQVNVMCGSQVIKQYPYSNLKVTKPGESDWRTAGGQKAPVFHKDLAVIRFADQNLKSTPIPVAFNGSSYFGAANAGQLTANLECILIGYGRSGSNAGVLHYSPMKDVLHFAPAYDENPMVVLVSKTNGSLITDSIDHGDSGGPLLCRQNGGSYFILGINESGDGGLDTYTGSHYNAFTPVFTSYSVDLIKRGLGTLSSSF